MKFGRIAFLFILGSIMFPGCTSSSGTHQDAPKNAVQSNTGPTVSGYVDVAGVKSIR
jgi:hypothetical protein